MAILSMAQSLKKSCAIFWVHDGFFPIHLSGHRNYLTGARHHHLKFWWPHKSLRRKADTISVPDIPDDLGRKRVKTICIEYFYSVMLNKERLCNFLNYTTMISLKILHQDTWKWSRSTIISTARKILWPISLWHAITFCIYFFYWNQCVYWYDRRLISAKLKLHFPI